MTVQTSVLTTVQTSAVMTVQTNVLMLYIVLLLRVIKLVFSISPRISLLYR